MNKKKTIDFGVIFVIFFLLCFLYAYITGCMNLHKIKQLEKHGEKVEVLVVDVEPGGLDEADMYTFSYTYNNIEYTYVDSPDHKVELGEKLEMFIDPGDPGKLVFASDSLPISFLLLIFVIGSMFMTDKFGTIKRNLLIVLLVIEAIMIATASIFNQIGLLICGIVLVLITVLLRRFIKTIGHIQDSDYKQTGETNCNP